MIEVSEVLLLESSAVDSHRMEKRHRERAKEVKKVIAYNIRYK